MWSNTKTIPIRLAISLSMAASASHAQTSYQINSGTGFYISMAGYVITNAHVVNGCDKAVVKNHEEKTIVDVVAADAQKDLALLRTNKAPLYAAPLRDNIKELKAGDRALVMGYPGDHALSGDYLLVDTQVLDVTGPLGNPDSIQFADAAQKGNSGGPLLDSSGNVIGVIVGKSEVYKINPITNEKPDIRHSDVAISINVLKSFLEQNGVYARDTISSLELSRDRIVDQAQHYVVNVQCVPDATKEDASLKEAITQSLTESPVTPPFENFPVEPASVQEHAPSTPDDLVIYRKTP